MARELRDLPASGRARRVFPWVVLILTFALLLSDHMSRQVVAAVFPSLSAEWALSDTQLGALSGVVPLVVGLLAVPLSLVSDRWGRVRAIVLMAVVWSLATLAAGFAGDYGQLMAARVCTGVGEAAYGSVGLAVVLAVFPPDRRASLTGAFLAGASFGSVLGLVLGGVLAVRFGWRWSFVVLGLIGLVLAGVYRLLVSDEKVARQRHPDPRADRPSGSRTPLATLVSTPSVVCAYVGSGLQLVVAGALIAWLPSWLGRGYDLPPDTAADVAAVAVLVLGAGMIGCGAVSDRLSRHRPVRQWTTAIAWSAASLALLGSGFATAPGPGQLALVVAGAFFAAGTAGSMGAVVVELTYESVRATGLGVLVLANNLLGLAAGPVVTGLLADRLGLAGALRVVPFAAVAAMAVFLVGRRTYPAGLRSVGAAGGPTDRGRRPAGT